ncbi:preprotein translocase subunit YajC [Gandjariella thermophila]|uniref:Preprotein translocase subunit YajC n=1 Tax=Gandjariella thermophila TaxID=1931992 RepID=A0A4D4IWT7_9PSEU|nr:preprotein translocase subunit YajC [Gandjariella thermophila]GDY28805.1 preprotein translocase subunit YajC [Gandjariella thermophila]
MNFSSLLFPLLIIALALPLFLSARKQKRSMHEMQQLQKSLEPGDRVMTTSGLYATVVDTSDDDTLDLEIAPGVTTTWLRAAVRERVRDTGADQDTAVAEDDEQEPAADVAEQHTTADRADEPKVAAPLEHEKHRG